MYLQKQIPVACVFDFVDYMYIVYAAVCVGGVLCTAPTTVVKKKKKRRLFLG